MQQRKVFFTTTSLFFARSKVSRGSQSVTATNRIQQQEYFLSNEEHTQASSIPITPINSGAEPLPAHATSDSPSFTKVQLPDWFEGRSNTPKWLQSKEISEKRAKGIFATSENDSIKSHESIKLIVETLDAEKGINAVVIDMFDKSEITDYMVIVEGRNQKHVYALADSVRRLFKKRYSPSTFMPDTLTIDGAETDWMTVDTGKVIVHCFMPEARVEYDLEGLWKDIKDPFIVDARNGFQDKAATAERISRNVKDGMENQFKLSLKRLETTDLVSEEEIKKEMS